MMVDHYPRFEFACSKIKVFIKIRDNYNVFIKAISSFMLRSFGISTVVFSIIIIIIFQENEHVIEDALSCFEDDFELIDCLQDWDRRGETSFAVGKRIQQSIIPS